MIFFALNASLPGYGQMPDWNTITDRDGNVYHIDKQGRIWTAGEPEFDYKPVSADGLDYYLNQGITLMRRHYPLDGLRILKSIMAMPANDNDRIREAQIKASQTINRYLKKEGTRYARLNRDASLLLYRENKRITLLDDCLRYSLSIDQGIGVLKRSIREKGGYLHQGVLLGIEAPTGKRADGDHEYQAILAIAAEQFRLEVGSVRRYREYWSANRGGDALIRKTLSRDDRSEIVEFADPQARYRGIEGYFIKGKRGYSVRIIAAAMTYDKNRAAYIAIIRGFRVI